MKPAVSKTNYSFLKTTSISYNVEGYGLLHDCKMFKLYDNSILVGQFFIHRKVCFIGFQERDLKVEVKSRFFRKSDYTIIDRVTGDKIGEYCLPNWVGGGLGKVGNVALGYETYECKMVLPDVRAKLFNTSTWGHHKMVLANDITTIVYHCQEGKGTDAFVKRDMFPLSGTIAAYNAELLLILCGFYMLEQGILNEEMIAT